MKGVVVWSVNKNDLLSEWMSPVRVPFWYKTRIHVAMTAPHSYTAAQGMVDALVNELCPEPDHQSFQVRHDSMGSVLYFANDDDA